MTNDMVKKMIAAGFFVGMAAGVSITTIHDRYLIHRYFMQHDKNIQDYVIEEIVEHVKPDDKPVVVVPENAMIELASQDELRDILQNNQKPAVVFLYMDGCGWCKKAKPIFEEIVKNPDFATILFYSVDGRGSQASAVVQELFNEKVTGFPTFLFLNQGKYVDKQVGFAAKDAFEDKISSIFFGKKPAVTNQVKKEEAQPKSACQHKKESIEPLMNGHDSPEFMHKIEAFLQAADQLPDEKFDGFKKIEDKDVQQKIDNAYQAYINLYADQNKFYVTSSENIAIKDGARKLFNCKLIRDMVWRGRVK